MANDTPLSAALPAFDVDPARGFLPSADPLPRLPSAFDAWEEAATHLPKLLVSDRVRSFLERLPAFDAARLNGDREHRRAMLLLSYLGHACVWGESEPAERLPAVLAVPWAEVAHTLGRPPVLSYASYALDNWVRLEPEGAIACGNIALLQNFLGGLDEEWFILIHVDIEAKAAPALAAVWQAQQAVRNNDTQALERHLAAIRDALGRIVETLGRMPEHCDPYIYYHRVRPYIHGWKNNPALPNGVIYEGVEAYGGRPQFFRGETGAQSSILPMLDAALGVTHRDDPLKTYLLEMRDYMPPKHRAFLAAIESGPSVRDFLTGCGAGCASLRDVYNECVGLVERFRAMHLQYAATYIFNQARKEPTNPSNVGTGGTPFMTYLKKHRDETTEHRL
jgi:indoleamine 2,3-dioxygenase